MSSLRIVIVAVLLHVAHSQNPPNSLDGTILMAMYHHVHIAINTQGAGTAWAVCAPTLPVAYHPRSRATRPPHRAKARSSNPSNPL